MLKKLLIANRGEIACRIARTARRMGIATVAVYSDADRGAKHVHEADSAIAIGPSPATESYLVIDAIIAAAKSAGADAIHPGYGFLSENADFPEACAKAGLTFVGPTGAAMRALGGKATAKEIAIKAGVPVVPGYQGSKQDAAALKAEARRIGYPVMIKAVAGGGGRGMRLVAAEGDFDALLDSAKREAASAFGNAQVLVEKVVVNPRHIEVQVFGDSHGNVVHLFERDCTLQRRNQKVLEEAPAPGMSEALRTKICGAAVKLAKSVGYTGAGTVEFLVEGGNLGAQAPWYFIEMNTRLQVEHPVTEEITGLDLVEWQLRIAAGDRLPLSQDRISMRGAAIEVRVCAEDPGQGFLPSIGRIAGLRLADGVRNEFGVRAGDAVSPYYDSMIGKVIASGADRGDALRKTAYALATMGVAGLKTNAGFLMALCEHPRVVAAQMDTGLIADEIAALTAGGVSAPAMAAGVAALIENANPSADDTPSPWAMRSGYQLTGERRLKLPFDVDGVTTAFEVRWDGRSPGVQVAAGDGQFVAWAAESGAAQVVVDDDAAYVIERGRHVRISRPAYDGSAQEAGDGGGNVRAPINGRVAKIFVRSGDSVDKGARIAVVEAMKMEHVLTARAPGRIETVAVVEGAQVVQGAVIAVIAGDA
jgi:3-methylcrotonyl-CoA carboxylase alpha subunit